MAAGDLEKKHAHAVLDAAYPFPFGICEYAKKSVHWQVERDKQGKPVVGGKRFPRSIREDLYNGAFDAVAVVPERPEHLVQWTSKAGLNARMIKVEARFLRIFEGRASLEWLEAHYRVECWGWIKGAGFEVRHFRWDTWMFERLGVMRSPASSAFKRDGWGLYLPWQPKGGSHGITADRVVPVPEFAGKRVRRGVRREPRASSNG